MRSHSQWRRPNGASGHDQSNYTPEAGEDDPSVRSGLGAEWAGGERLSGRLLALAAGIQL